MENRDEINCADNPSALVSIIRAAKIARDRELERAARRELRSRFGIELKIADEIKHEGSRNAR